MVGNQTSNVHSLYGEYTTSEQLYAISIFQIQIKDSR